MTKSIKESLVYVNKEISSAKEDYIGVSAYADSITEAIDAGASMIGIIADYGYGKSSLVELIAEKNQEDKSVIKVNMWDSSKDTTPKSKDNASTNTGTVSFLEKSFLYQIALKSNKPYLARHINKRLNGNNGLISFTSKKNSIWIYFVIAVALVAMGMFIHAFDFSVSIDGFSLTNFIYTICYLLSGVVMIFGLRNSSFSFSSWKSEGIRVLDDSDIFSIYSEIVDVIDHKHSLDKKTKIIIIEDLDRFDDTYSVVNFIKTVYRFNTLSTGHNICFVISIKPEHQLKKELKESVMKSHTDEIDYNKWFDFIVDLKPIHFQDYKSILTNLLKEKENRIYDLTNKKLDYSEYQILIDDKNLNIRVLKQRLNYALILFSSLKEKQIGDTKMKINMRTCCAVSFLKTKFENDYYTLLKHEDEFNSIIKESIKSIAKKTLTSDNLVREIVGHINRFISPNDLEEAFKYRLANYISNGIIGDDYRMYFYSYPKGSYIKTLEENELEDLILSQSDSDVDVSHLNDLVEISFKRGGNIIKYCLDLLKEIPKSFPTIVLKNERLLSYAYNNYAKETIDSLKLQLLWNKENEDNTVKYLSIINSYSLQTSSKILSDYAEAISSHVASLGIGALSCREKLVGSLGKSIELFESVFKHVGVPILTEKEIELLDEKPVFKLLNANLINTEILLVLLKRFSQFSHENGELITQWIVSQLRNMSAEEETIILLVSFMHRNGISNDQIFHFIMTKYFESMHGKITEYLNSLENISTSYLKDLNGLLFVARFKDSIYEAMLGHGYHLLYLVNRICTNTLSHKDYDQSIFDESVLKQLQSVEPRSIYIDYRKFLLDNNLGSKENYHLLFNRNTPFVTKEEIGSLSCDYFADIYDNDNMPIGIDAELIEFIQDKVKTAQDAYIMAKIVLKATNLNKQDIVFKSIPFAKAGYNVLESEKKLEIKNLYSEIVNLEKVSDIIGYMQITNDVEILEKALVDILLKESEGSDEWDADNIGKLIDVCNEIGYVSDLLIDLIIKSDLELPLCDAITNQLFTIKNFRQFIIGKTLFYSEFSYVKGIPFADYLNVYVNASEKVWSLMKESNDFLIDIYNTNSFDQLSIEQLFLYNNWDQKIELIKTVLEKCDTDEQRADYILNMRVLKSLNDSDEFQRYICNTQYSSLMFREDVFNKVKELLWDDHPANKANLTRWLNRIRKTSV